MDIGSGVEPGQSLKEGGAFNPISIVHCPATLASPIVSNLIPVPKNKREKVYASFW